MAMPVVMGVTVMMMMMAVGVGGKHLNMLYYNITSAKAFKKGSQDKAFKIWLSKP